MSMLHIGQSINFLPSNVNYVIPCDLCMVTAQANFRGICNNEQLQPEVDQVQPIGVIGTVLSAKVGPV